MNRNEKAEKNMNRTKKRNKTIEKKESQPAGKTRKRKGREEGINKTKHSSINISVSITAIPLVPINM